MSGVVTAVAVVGTLASVVGSVVQGQNQAAAAQAQAQAQAQNYKFQQQADQYQANIAKMNADSAHQQAASQEDLQRTRFRQLQAQAITGMAEAGTDPMSGSNLDVLHQNAVNNEMDALNIRYQGEQQARGLLAQSALDNWNANVAGYNQQAAINTGNMTASAAKTAGYFGAGTGLLSGATNIASTYKNMTA